MAAVRHLGFVRAIFGPPTMSTWWSSVCAKLGWNRCSSFHNMHVSVFCVLGLKKPIHAPKLGFLGDLIP